MMIQDAKELASLLPHVVRKAELEQEAMAAK
jgi:hypothetical protein